MPPQSRSNNPIVGNLKKLSLAVALAIATSPSLAAVYNLVGTASSAYIRLVSDGNGGYTIKNKVDGTETSTHVEDRKLVAEFDLNSDPANKLTSGNYLMLFANETQIGDVDIVRINLYSDMSFPAMNPYSSWSGIEVSYGKGVEINADSNKTVNVQWRPNDYNTGGVTIADDASLELNGGNFHVVAVGDYEFDSEQAVIDFSINGFTTTGDISERSGDLIVKNDSFIVESQLTTESDYIKAFDVYKGNLDVDTKTFKIFNQEDNQRFNSGIYTYKSTVSIDADDFLIDANSALTVIQSKVTLSADNLQIDSDVAISAQDEGTLVDISGGDVQIFGRVEAYTDSEIVFSQNDSYTDSLVKIITTETDAVVGNPSDLIKEITGSPVITFETDTFISSEGALDSDGFTYKSGEFGYAAVRANRSSTINLNNDDATYTIYGNLVAGRGVETDEKGGTINLSGSGSVIVGDVIAGNTGTINLTLQDGAYFEGRADDYADAELENKVFRTGYFSIPVTEKGEVNLKMNNALWIARGNSFITSLIFEGDASTNVIDLTKDERSALTIGSLSGEGTIKMRVDAESEDHSNGDMVYVRDTSDGSLTINVVWVNDVAIEEGEWIRVATVNGEDASKLRVESRDQGFFNVVYPTMIVDRSTDPVDDEAYDGIASDIESGKTSKPGVDHVDEVFSDGQNVYIGYKNQTPVEPEEPGTDPDNPDTDPDIPITPPSSEISDAGNALLATAKAAYWNAIEIDRFSNRMGDIRYANGADEGLWLRIRHGRLGTNEGVGDFRSHNTMYQVGFDHSVRYDSGRQLFGIALDYMDNSIDYNGIEGDGESDRYAVTAYTTWMGDSGVYVDVVGKYGRLRNDFEIINGSGGLVTADYTNHMLGLSVEAGRKLTNDFGMFIEPNAQIQYVRVTDAKYSTSQNTRVEQDDLDSLIARMGTKVGRTWGKNNMTVYAKADVAYEFMGDQDFHVTDVTSLTGGETVEIENSGFWSDVGFGVQRNFGKDAFAYVDVEHRFGNDLENTWIFNAGMRYQF